MNKIITTEQALATDQDFDTILADFLRLNVAQGDASEHTIKSIYTNLATFAGWCDDQGIVPTAASEDDIRNYRAWLVEQDYKPSTIHIKLVALRKLFEAAVWRGLRADNPAAGVKSPTDKSDRADTIRFLPLEGYTKLLSSFDKSTRLGRRDRAIITLLGLHGLRVFEVAKLKFTDIDDKTISIIGKGKRKRTAILTDATKLVLDAWLLDRAVIKGDDEYIFVSLGNSSYGKPLTIRGIRHIVDKALTDVGLKAPGISCHSLRHSFATWSLFKGAKIEHVQASLGHSNRDTTAIYQGIVDRVKHNPTLLLDSILETV